MKTDEPITFEERYTCKGRKNDGGKCNAFEMAKTGYCRQHQSQKQK